MFLPRLLDHTTYKHRYPPCIVMRRKHRQLSDNRQQLSFSAKYYFLVRIVVCPVLIIITRKSNILIFQREKNTKWVLQKQRKSWKKKQGPGEPSMIWRTHHFHWRERVPCTGEVRRSCLMRVWVVIWTINTLTAWWRDEWWAAWHTASPWQTWDMTRPTPWLTSTAGHVWTLLVLTVWGGASHTPG